MDQGAFEFCPRARETNEAAAAQFRRPPQIEQLKFRAETSVILNRPLLVWLFTPDANDRICCGIPANRDPGMRQVWNLQEQTLLSFFAAGDLLRELGDLISNLANTLFQFLRGFAPTSF